MMLIRVFFVVISLSIGVVGCGGGGGGPDSAPAGTASDTSNLTLSLTEAAPGDLLVISHTQIAAGSELTVVFEQAGAAKAVDASYEVSAKTALTYAGSAMIAVPPYLDAQSVTVMSGEVTVRVNGIDASAVLTINEPEELLDMAPGEATLMVVDFAIDEYLSSLDRIDTLTLEEQALFADWVDHAESALESLEVMADELAAQRLTVSDGSNTVTLEGAQLMMLDRLLAAHFSGIADAAAVIASRSLHATALLSTPRDLRTREGFADILRKIKNVGIPGVQAAASYVTVGVGAVSLVVALVPAGQPLATAGAGFAMFTTLIATVGAATGGFFVDLSIDAVEGRNPDVHKALDGALIVVRDGVVSIALTAAGGVQWAGSTLAGFASLINDGKAGRDGLRDLRCGVSGRSVVARATVGEFCTATTAGGVPAIGLFSADISVPGYSLSFNPTVSVASPTLWIGLQDALALVAVEGTNADSEYISMTLNPNVIRGPGTYSVSSDLFSSAVIFVYSTPAIQHASVGLPIDDTNVSFSGFSGTITITGYGESVGETIAGAYSVQISGQQITGIDQDDDVLTIEHMGTASGSFSLPVLAANPIALP